MANTNAPYGFRLWTRLNAGTGAIATAPGAAAGGTYASSGQIPVASATTLHVGDPIRLTQGLGLLATGTYAISYICNSPVPGYGETAVQKHYPELIPADDQTIFRCQSIGTVNVTQGYIGVKSKGRAIGGTTSGYTGIGLSTSGALQVVALAPGSAFGTYAELLVMVTRGTFYGAP